jgi:coproporphyrinogen dehydrogenase HemZ
LVFVCFPKSFIYDVKDVLKLFFMDEDIAEAVEEPPPGSRGVFLSGRYSEADGKPVFRIQLKGGEAPYFRDLPAEPKAGELLGYEMRKTLKNEIKRHVFDALSGYAGFEPPWGILTGIRPAKIVHERLAIGLTEDYILARLRDYYRIRPDKARLLYDVAQAEKKVLDRTEHGGISIYIGIPFCATRCVYCSFTSNPISKYAGLVGSYLEALRRDIVLTGRIIKDKGHRIQSVYIGGGTPTSIDAPDLRKLLLMVEENLDLGATEEYTLEAGRPDSLDKEKLKIIRDSRVSRISINPQTMNDETLKAIGRNHTSGDIVRAFGLARETGFDNINADLIAGLPGETPAMFEHTLQQVWNLHPEYNTDDRLEA